MSKQYYQIKLFDYSVPAFCSFSKRYFGSASNFDQFMTDFETAVPDSETVKTYKEYKSGNKSAKHNVLFHKEELLKTAQPIAVKKISENEVEWTYINCHGCDCKIAADNIKGVAVVFKADDGVFVVASRLRFINARYENGFSEQYTLLNGFTMGHPGIVNFKSKNDNIIMCNTIYSPCREFKTETDAVNYLNSQPNSNCYNAVLEDVFGDG